MVEVIRLRISLYEGNRRLPWKALVRSLIAAACVTALGLNAGYCSKVYQELQEKQNIEESIDMMPSFGNFPVNVSELSGAAGMMFVRVPNIPDVEKDRINTEKSVICAEEDNETAVHKTAAHRTEEKEKDILKAVAKGREKEDMPLVTDPAGSIEHSDKLAIEDNTGELDVPVEGGENSEAEIRISVYGNGGIPEMSDTTCKASAFTVDMLTAPRRMGKLFDKWYLDKECRIPFMQIEPGQKELILYAGWMEFPGFISNDLGHITGCTPDAVVDGLLCVPDYEECTGIESGAFDSLKASVIEVYIPENITYIAAGTFDCLSELVYIEAASGNPVYYSDNGIVYYMDGTEAFRPAKRIKR